MNDFLFVGEITDMRLFNGRNRQSGILQVEVDGMWNQVCGLRQLGRSVLWGNFTQSLPYICKRLGHWPLLLVYSCTSNNTHTCFMPYVFYAMSRLFIDQYIQLYDHIIK